MSSAVQTSHPKPRCASYPPVPSYPRGRHEKVMLEGFYHVVSNVHNEYRPDKNKSKPFTRMPFLQKGLKNVSEKLQGKYQSYIKRYWKGYVKDCAAIHQKGTSKLNPDTSEILQDAEFKLGVTMQNEKVYGHGRIKYHAIDSEQLCKMSKRIEAMARGFCRAISSIRASLVRYMPKVFVR